MHRSAVPSLLACFALVSVVLCSTPLSAQTTSAAPSGSSDFKVAPPKDEVLGNTKDGQHRRVGQSRANSPERTVGPQLDGSIVVSDNQTLTPAGRLIELGSPVRAKALALNPGKSAHTAAVLLMGSPQPIIVFDTDTGHVLQRFLPEGAPSAARNDRSTGSFAGVAYSPDGSRLLFSQDNNYVSVAAVDRKTGLLRNEQRVVLPPPPADGACLP